MLVVVSHSDDLRVGGLDLFEYVLRRFEDSLPVLLELGLTTRRGDCRCMINLFNLKPPWCYSLSR